MSPASAQLSASAAGLWPQEPVPDVPHGSWLSTMPKMDCVVAAAAVLKASQSQRAEGPCSGVLVRSETLAMNLRWSLGLPGPFMYAMQFRAPSFA